MIGRRRVITGLPVALAARDQSAQPAELPIEQPTCFDLVVNAGAAKALDLRLPLSARVREHEIVQ